MAKPLWVVLTAHEVFLENLERFGVRILFDSQKPQQKTVIWNCIVLKTKNQTITYDKPVRQFLMWPCLDIHSRNCSNAWRFRKSSSRSSSNAFILNFSSSSIVVTKVYAPKVKLLIERFVSKQNFYVILQYLTAVCVSRFDDDYLKANSTKWSSTRAYLITFGQDTQTTQVRLSASKALQILCEGSGSEKQIVRRLNKLCAI